MCGIVGYVGNRQASPIILDGLKGLEYRGYDSAGIAVIENGHGEVTKQAGRVDGLIETVDKVKFDSTLGIGHTRWATHGEPSLNNAHPHTNKAKTIFVVHNGIIENYQIIKAKLVKEGYSFVSETDTEVIPHLLDFYYNQSKDFSKALTQTLDDLRGAYALAVITTYVPNKLYAARLSSPLVIGVGENEFILASDPTALIQHTKKVIFLEDYDVAEISQDTYKITNIKDGQDANRKASLIDYDNQEILLGDYPHFMIKEISEAPGTIRNASLGRALSKQGIVKLGGLESVTQQLNYIDRIVIVACGTSYYAGMVGEYLIEEIAGIPVEVQLSSEFKYRSEPFSRSTAIIAISQSGETADTIAALKKVDDYGVLKLGIVNAVGSTIARITDAGVYCHAGPEQAVASTKAFIAQVTVLILVALHLSKGDSNLFKPLLKELDDLPAKAEKVVSLENEIKELAEKYKDYKDFMFIGRNINYPTALEGALKLKEISYIHAEGYAAGEMKHGPLALIDKDFPTFAIATDDKLLDKTYSNIEEIKARKGPILAIASDGNEEIDKLADDVIKIPKTLSQTQPLLIAIVMQLLSYHVSVLKSNNVDRPRNLAKSVTVE